MFCFSVRAEESPIAYVKVVNGTCIAIQQGEERPLNLGDPLFKADILKTSKESSLGVSFRDNTLISLGSSSQLRLENFEFDPDNNQLAFAVELFEGTLLYISGLIAKLTKKPEEELRITTPAGTVTVRGTRLFINAEQ
ncbi:FecR domain-containing protein [Kiloniella laminariae]|uniref:FecR domain-containing protein n=1 Tax=Kiloniella laminariae TaxID=454162 RepID=A0ABT4LLK2_9PROT|nr:FecR domain-containing protein [Kiloniella laminariae]MCZ4281981.1 FecR domain-containing protein [Kiloniella laminariae]